MKALFPGYQNGKLGEWRWISLDNGKKGTSESLMKQNHKPVFVCTVLKCLSEIFLEISVNGWEKRLGTQGYWFLSCNLKVTNVLFYKTSLPIDCKISKSGIKGLPCISIAVCSLSGRSCVISFR